MKLLMYQNRKFSPMIIDVSTPEKEKAGILLLFNHLDKDWQVYEGTLTSKFQKDLYDKAKAGDSLSALKLMSHRRTWEYEEFRFLEAIDPLVESV